MLAAATSASTPCNRICVLDAAKRLCVGCGRSLDEIARWGGMTEAERKAIMTQLPARLAAMTNADPSPRT